MWINYDRNHFMDTENGMIVINTCDLKNIQPSDIKGYDFILTPPTLKTYEFCLYDKLQKDFIDSTLIPNCKDRAEALSRVKRLMMSQGLRLSKYGYTLKKTNKVKEYIC